MKINPPLTRSWELTRQQIEDMRSIAQDKGDVDIIGDSGTAEKMGVMVNYKYEGGTLTLTATEKPFLLPLFTVQKYLDKFEGYIQQLKSQSSEIDMQPFANEENK